MANIFFSWSSPDAALVLPLRDRLLDVGIDLWEYSEAMAPGDYIHGSIIDAINGADIAVICFSDATADREWIVREAEWCFKARADGNWRLRHIVPVWIGPHPDNKVPGILADNQIRTTDLHGVADAEVATFVVKLCGLLGRKAPLVVPAALFAMTRAQCEALLARQDKRDTLATLCAEAGMSTPPPIEQVLPARYGDRSQDLAPFVSGKPLVETIAATLRQVNARRAAEGKLPIFLRWMHDELVGPARQQAARDLWAASYSLLVVDSVSTFDADIQEQLSRLPQPKIPERAALLWLPPYTQHTARLEQSLCATALEIPQLGDAFADWCAVPTARALTFDTTTPTGARLWLHRTLAAIEDRQAPLQQNVAAMQGIGQASIQPNQMFLPPGR